MFHTLCSMILEDVLLIYKLGQIKSAEPTKPGSMNPFLNIICIFAEESCLSRCYPAVKRRITIKLSVNKTF